MMIRVGLRAMARGGYGALLLAFGCVAQAQGEPGVLKRPAELREAPGDGARSLAALPVHTAVSRLGDRQGPWIRVATPAGASGWVHMFDVGPASGAAATSASPAGGNAATGALRGLSNLFNKGGSQPATLATSTIGIRGLGAEDLANAQPNPAAVGQMEALRMTDRQARDFAAQAPLAAVVVEALPAPARLASPSSGNPSGAAGQMP